MNQVFNNNCSSQNVNKMRRRSYLEQEAEEARYRLMYSDVSSSRPDDDSPMHKGYSAKQTRNDVISQRSQV